METVAQRYDRLAGLFADKLAAVPPARWGDLTPCEGWTTLDLARHVSESPAPFFGFVEREPAELLLGADDPEAAFAAARRSVLAGLADPDVADAGFDGLFGPTTFAESIDRFISFDLIVHGWDLARTVGLDETIADADLDHVEAGIEVFGDKLRVPYAFGPAVEPPPGASRQTRVLCFLGRPA